MASLSITAAWNESTDFVKREAQLLFPIAFLLIALPGAILQLTMPAVVPGTPPRFGTWLLLMPVVAVSGMIGTIALSYLALRPGASVGEALQVGVRRFIILFAASLLIGLGAVIAMIPLLFLFGGAAMAGGAPSAATMGSLLLFMLIFLVAIFALWVRLMLMTPVTAAENAGPIGIIRRSWQLTRGHFWKLLGFVLLVVLLFLVVSIVVGAIGGLLIVLLAGQPAPGSASSFLILLVGALVNMVLTVYFTVLVARIYTQLSGSGPQDVFA